MKKLSRKHVFTLVALFTVVLASWAVSASAPEIKHPLDPEQYINSYLVANPSTLDISLRSDTYSSTIMINTMEGLIRMEERDGDYFLAPGDAYKWESNEDGTVWTFYLGDNKWEDGVPVTADHTSIHCGEARLLKLARPTATSSPLSRILLKSTEGNFPLRSSV